MCYDFPAVIVCPSAVVVVVVLASTSFVQFRRLFAEGRLTESSPGSH